MTARSAAPALASALLALLLAGPAAAKERFPAFTNPVVDAANVVPDDVQSRLDAALVDYQRRSGNQIAVAVVTTTGSTAIEDYSIDLARAWGVGQKGNDNGVLLLIAYRDRKLRIEVGRGLEGTLTDLDSGRIIRERLVPLLREGRVGDAVVQGTDAIRQRLGDTEVGALPPPPAPAPPRSTGLPVLGLVTLLGLGSLGLFGRRRHRRVGFGLPIFWGGGFGGYGGYGGGFGGAGAETAAGFGGGGGGDFGGGGASGGW